MAASPPKMRPHLQIGAKFGWETCQNIAFLEKHFSRYVFGEHVNMEVEMKAKMEGKMEDFRPPFLPPKVIHEKSIQTLDHVFLVKRLILAWSRVACVFLFGS